MVASLISHHTACLWVTKVTMTSKSTLVFYKPVDYRLILYIHIFFSYSQFQYDFIIGITFKAILSVPTMRHFHLLSMFREGCFQLNTLNNATYLHFQIHISVVHPHSRETDHGRTSLRSNCVIIYTQVGNRAQELWFAAGDTTTHQTNESLPCYRL